MKANYHAHTVRCKHAHGTEEEFVLHAIAQGYDEFGFSDHGPWPFEGGFVSGIRMLPEELDGYVKTVRALEKKYADKIKLFCGLESEYFPSMLDWLREKKEEMGLDYLLLGNHFDTLEGQGMYFGRAVTPEDIHRYCDRTTKGMQTGMFLYTAHPDLCFRSYAEFDADAAAVSRELCRCANAMHMPLEYNLLGTRYNDTGMNKGQGYPCRGFWEIAAEENCRAIIGTDAHELYELDDGPRFENAVQYLASLGIRRVTCKADI